jgi:hypothetical protein
VIARVVGAGARTIYRGGDWAVVLSGRRAVALHLTGRRWRADRSGRVAVRILGPLPRTRAARVPQVAVEVTAPAPLVESGLWVDGHELDVKGGGTPRRGTIYGAPAKPLARGWHVATGYARTATTGTAVAWPFRV